ncbi:glycosyltransferase family 39 protein [Conexibacter sp. CPCC 206217]|uniref:glycosyltransferase family 39 protein n=1 Tax=Conexibacter sp. CPCC 206217 TaxID=3064574 RepID=UPI002722122A|nr:glycosyltransferase family 39 protein [Conexibacter sp. CPCC 206217]MDO8209861.1 glycosyltransferase family 39 protein [Conexibacter sp. CPCC 206217]
MTAADERVTSSAPAQSAWQRHLLAPILLLSAVLGVIALGTRSFWLDEGTSITIAKLPWSGFVDVTERREGNMSLYHLLLSWWMEVGDSEFWIRLLSVIFFVIAVWALYAVARRLASERVALTAALLLAVCPFAIRYAQEARGYILGLLLVTVATLLFVRALDRQTWGLWLAYSLFAALGVYAHFFALLVPAAHAVSLVFVAPERLRWRKLIGAAVAIGVLLLPFAYLLSQNTSSGVEWAAGNPIGRIFTQIHDRPPLAAAVVLLGAVVVVALYLLLRSRLGARLRSDEVWRWALPLSWLLVPLVAMSLVAVVIRPLFVPKYFIVCLPAALLLVAMLIDRIRARQLALGLVGLIVVVSLAADLRWYRTGQEEDWRHATAYVVDSAQPGDGVMFYPPYVRIPFALYLDRDSTRDRAPPPVYPSAGFTGDEIRYDYYIPITENAVARAAAGYRQIYLVTSHTFLNGEADPGYEATVDGLRAAGFSEGPSRHFTGVDVVRYDAD